MPQSTTRRRSRRRRNTDSDKQIGRRLKQLWARVPEGLAATIGFAAIVPIGILLMWYGRPNNQVPGAAVITLGLTGLIWQAWKWRLRRIEDQTRRQNYEMRAERRRVRRRREADEVELEHKRVAQDKAAHAGAREAEESRRRLEAEQASVEERRRAGREEAIARDATRLLTLPEADLITAVREAFRARGFAAAPVDDEARRGDLVVLHLSSDLNAVARCVPRNRKAEAADVQALDVWRENSRVATGYLISMAGFGPGAVRLASTLPIILVEAHLLAQWLGTDAPVEGGSRVN